jgi:hypothetical protein
MSQVYEHEITLWWEFSKLGERIQPPEPKPYRFRLITVHTPYYETRTKVTRVRVDCIEPLSPLGKDVVVRGMKVNLCKALQAALAEELGDVEVTTIRSQVLDI